jgi:gliding motility-associated-like protein
MKKLISFLFKLLFIPSVLIAQGSLFLPGPINFVTVGDLDVPGNQLTVEALIHYTGVSVNIVSKHTDPSNVNYLLRIGSFEITTTNGFANFSGVAAAGVTFIPYRTYHLAATYNGQFLRYYVNGCLTGQMAWSGNMIQNNLLTAIGAQSNCLCEQFTGYIDEVRIWNVARTQAQIAANMLDLPNPTLQPGLLGYWKFNGNYTNLQGNAAFNGTPIGAPQFQQIPYPYPSALHATVTSSNPICSGEANGLINVAASGLYTPYEYSLDGVNFTTNPVFPNLPAGNYTVFTRPQNNNNCVVTTPVTITDPAVLNANLSTTNISCNGANNGSASVAPSGGDGPPYNQLWVPQNSVATSINNLAPGSYSVIISDSCRQAGPELVVNGSFENGATGFTSDYVHCTTCYAGINNLDVGMYLVSFNAALHHAAFVGTGNGGGGNFLNVNGGSIPNTNVWCQTISVTPNTYYTFSTWVASLHPSSPAILQFSINGNPLGAPFNAPPATGLWSQFFTTWFSGGNTSATICIVNQNTVLNGNDFALDDISFKQCLSCIDTIPYTITEPTALQLTTTQTDVSCNGGNNGTATVNPTGGTAPYTYSWNTSPVQTTATANNLIQGTYTVTVTDFNNCSQTSTVTITEPPALTLVLDNKTNPTCFGANNGQISVVANGGVAPYTFTWNPNVSTSSTANNLSAGSYNVTVTDGNLCSQTLTIVLVEPPALNLNVSATSTSICLGQTTTLTATATGGTGTLNYLWSNLSNQSSQTVQPTTTTMFYISVTDSFNCLITDSILIAVNTITPVNLGNDTSFCFGNQITLDAGAGFASYQWQNGSSSQTFQVTQSNMYHVIVTDVNGCEARDTIFVTVHPLPDPGLPANISFCPGSSVNLSAANGFSSYLWNTGATTNSISISSLGFYGVVVQDANGCINTDTTIAILHPLPILNFNVQPSSGCSPLDVKINNFSSLNGSVVTNWQWTIGGQTSFMFEPSFTLSDTGFYNLNLNIITNNNCVIDTTVNNIVRVFPTPIAKGVPSKALYEQYDPEILIYNESLYAETYKWYFADDVISETENLKFAIVDSGEFVFQLVAINSYGCIDTTDIIVKVLPDFALYFPNAFTPDGNTVNEFFAPKGFGVKEYRLLIFNRWGELIFETESPYDGWDGIYKGLPAKPDSYLYKCNFTDYRNRKHERIGHFNLIR